MELLTTLTTSNLFISLITTVLGAIFCRAVRHAERTHHVERGTIGRTGVGEVALIVHVLRFDAGVAAERLVQR